MPDLAHDPKFVTNSARVTNREELIQIMTDVLMTGTKDEWLEKFKDKG